MSALISPPPTNTDVAVSLAVDGPFIWLGTALSARYVAAGFIDCTLLTFPAHMQILGEIR
jgi:hypothetical protein